MGFRISAHAQCGVFRACVNYFMMCACMRRSLSGNFVGAAAHADDLRTIAASKCSVQEQVDIINKFTSSNHLKLNS